MSKNTNQSSGVVAGTLDLSTRSTLRPARVTGAGVVLARRKHAVLRAKKLAALKRMQAKARASAKQRGRSLPKRVRPSR